MPTCVPNLKAPSSGFRSGLVASKCHGHLLYHLDGIGPKSETGDGTQEAWVDGGQPWPQAGRTSDRLAAVPNHGPEGGGDDSPQNVVELKSIVEPAINWVYGSYTIGGMRFLLLLQIFPPQWMLERGRFSAVLETPYSPS